ncbi:hypothetical protein CYY_007873 [Polysphondylium violaceum]|uniref:Pleckstrin domain-containing protein n=1 Tax=Polysphondylium violaceum TaxID=133409 RepID=A0A8J4PQ59_9MYCE|nr:hypothetical protein CYY_007873 [Polysphondylium violaceum]
MFGRLVDVEDEDEFKDEPLIDQPKSGKKNKDKNGTGKGGVFGSPSKSSASFGSPSKSGVNSSSNSIKNSSNSIKNSSGSVNGKSSMKVSSGATLNSTSDRFNDLHLRDDDSNHASGSNHYNYNNTTTSKSGNVNTGQLVDIGDDDGFNFYDRSSSSDEEGSSGDEHHLHHHHSNNSSENSNGKLNNNNNQRNYEHNHRDFEHDGKKKSKIVNILSKDYSAQESEKTEARRASAKENIKKLTDKQSDLDKSIGKYLSIIEKPWIVEPSSDGPTIEGELLKKKRFASGWKKYYFALSGNNLYYYKSKKTKKPKGIITISFVTPPIPMTEKTLLDIKTPYVSNYQLQLYSTKRIDCLCASSNEDFERWNTVLQSLVKANVHPHDYDNRLDAWGEIYPLFDQKSEVELDRLLLLLAEIDSYSTHIINRAKKLKSGNLLMMEEDEDTGDIRWRSYYFTLVDRCIYYYKSSKLPPQGVITLKFSELSLCSPEISSDLLNAFKLSTPLSVYILKAKHAVAMEEWVTMIQDTKININTKKTIIDKIPGAKEIVGSAKDKDGTTKERPADYITFAPSPVPVKSSVPQVLNENGESAQEIQGYGKKYTPVFTYYPIGSDPAHDKPKVVKMALGENTIGRSKSCTITLDDKKISRSHCKIEVTENSVVLMDLGSGHGTKVNGKRSTSKKLIYPNDEIKIGYTILKFDAIPKDQKEKEKKKEKDKIEREKERERLEKERLEKAALERERNNPYNK